MRLVFYLAPYSEAVLHLPDKVNAATNAGAELLHPYRLFSNYAVDPTNLYYELKNVHMTMDMLDLHPSYLQEIREIAQGQTGFYINKSKFIINNITTNITFKRYFYCSSAFFS